MVTQLIQKYKTRSQTLNWVIGLAVIGLMLSLILDGFSKEADPEGALLNHYFMIPMGLKAFIVQLWSLATWPFIVPAEFSYLFGVLINCLFLYQFGQLLHQFIGEEKFRSFLLITLLFNAALTLAVGNLLAGDKMTYLFGLSSTLVAVIVAVITLAPKMKMQLVLFGPVRLWVIGSIVVAFKIFSFSAITNPPEMISIFAGALAGFGYIRLLREGNDVPGEVKGAFQGANPKSKPTFTIVPKDAPLSRQEEIDRILDKINDVGYKKLSKSEKEFLASEDER